MPTPPTEPVMDPVYWGERLSRAVDRGVLHTAVFMCSVERWDRIAEKHAAILRATIQPTESVLDAGCGWGRLLDIMPNDWCGDYVGVDIAPAFIKVAQLNYPHRRFHVRSLLDLDDVQVPDGVAVFDWAVLISIRPMIVRNCGREVWDKMEMGLRVVARKLLYLEYDPNDNGSVE